MITPNAHGKPFDKNNPPARLFFEGGQPSLSGYLLDAEREWARSCTERFKADPHRYARPMFIVRLKAWKPIP